MNSTGRKLIIIETLIFFIIKTELKLVVCHFPLIATLPSHIFSLLVILCHSLLNTFLPYLRFRPGFTLYLTWLSYSRVGSGILISDLIIILFDSLFILY